MIFQFIKRILLKFLINIRDDQVDDIEVLLIPILMNGDIRLFHDLIISINYF
jgi:hypothetical protein